MREEDYEEVRRRVAEDPKHHSYQQWVARLEAEKSVASLPSDPESDEDRHRWICFIAATTFCTYNAAAEVFTRDVVPKLRRAIEIKAEQAALARRVAAAKPAAPPPTIAEQRMLNRLEAKRVTREAAAARKAALSDDTSPKDAA